MNILNVLAALEQMSPMQCKMLRAAIEVRIKALDDEKLPAARPDAHRPPGQSDGVLFRIHHSPN